MQALYTRVEQSFNQSLEGKNRKQVKINIYILRRIEIFP